MSNEIFTFVPLSDYEEGFRRSIRFYQLEGGYEQRSSRWSSGKFFANNLQLRCPPNVPTTFTNFWNVRSGQLNTFLYKPKIQAHHQSVLENIGTGDGVATSFVLSMKHIDNTDLSVFINGTETTGFTLASNHSNPRVVFAAAPASSLLTSTYDFLIPVRFVDESYVISAMHYTGNDLTSTFVVQVGVTQDNPGSHIV